MKALDLKYKRFGRLTPLEKVKGSVKVKTRWICLCDCGNKATVATYQLTSGGTKSCGCLRKEMVSKRLTKNLIGRRFGRLVVVERNGSALGNYARWKCRCDCGEECNIISTNLLKGLTVSCGCYRKEYMSVSQTGMKNFNWKGGICNDPYPVGFNEKLKELIRERDEYKCQICNLEQERYGTRLCVHHIDYNKENISLNNLISVCRPCHTQTNHNRKKWKNFFMLRRRQREARVG